MGSKKLFFNFNMILRDIKMHWPIWVMALAGYTLTCTAVISLGTFRSLDYDYDIASEVVGILSDTNHFFAATLGIVIAVASFGYLTKKRKHYFFESLPFNRLSLFATRYLFGVIVFMIPLISIYVIEIIQTAMHGYFGIWELTQWLIVAATEYLFWFSLGVIVLVISGRIGMAGFCYLGIATAWLLLKTVIEAYAQILYIGINSGLGWFETTTYNILSPIEFFADMGPKFSYDISGPGDLYPEGTFIKVLIALVVAILFTVGAMILYNRRKAEKTDDNLVFPAVKVIFSWAFAFFSAMGFGMMFIALFISAETGQAHIMSNKIGIMFIILILGFVGYMASCMIVEKKFRVISQNLVKCGIFLAVLALFMIGMFCDVFNIEKFVPDKKDCTYANISGEYSLTGEYQNLKSFNRAGVNKTVDLLQIVIDNFDDVCYKEDDFYNHNTKRLQIHINMKSGYLNRTYYIPQYSTLDKKVTEFMRENIGLYTDGYVRYYEDDSMYEYEGSSYYYD